MNETKETATAITENDMDEILELGEEIQRSLYEMAGEIKWLQDRVEEHEDIDAKSLHDWHAHLTWYRDAICSVQFGDEQACERNKIENACKAAAE